MSLLRKPGCQPAHPTRHDAGHQIRCGFRNVVEAAPHPGGSRRRLAKCTVLRGWPGSPLCCRRTEQSHVNSPSIAVQCGSELRVFVFRAHVQRTPRWPMLHSGDGMSEASTTKTRLRAVVKRTCVKTLPPTWRGEADPAILISWHARDYVISGTPDIERSKNNEVCALFISKVAFHSHRETRPPSGNFGVLNPSTAAG